MGKAISHAKREMIVKRRQSGAGYDEIANDLGLSTPGVKKIWYAYQKEGEAGLQTKYGNCGRNSKYGDEVREQLSDIRDNNQGADYVASKFIQAYPDQPCPSPRTLQRWWQAQGTSLPRGRVSNTQKKPGADEPMKCGRLMVRNKLS